MPVEDKTSNDDSVNEHNRVRAKAIRILDELELSSRVSEVLSLSGYNPKGCLAPASYSREANGK